jgi:hypothetical protein
MIIDKWVEGYIERKKQKKIDKTRLENWSKLYEKLHGYTPHCGYCANFSDCIKKYKKSSRLPKINGVTSCREFKSDGKDRLRGHVSGVSGWSGLSGVSGISGVSGVSAYNSSGQRVGTWQPPWNRGAQSCNRLCNNCSYHNGTSCTKP